MRNRGKHINWSALNGSTYLKNKLKKKRFFFFFLNDLNCTQLERQSGKKKKKTFKSYFPFYIVVIVTEKVW